MANRSLHTWYLTNTMVRFGDGLLAFALGWEAAQISGRFVAVVGLAYSIPMIAFLLLGGFAGDRLGQFGMLRSTWLASLIVSVAFLVALLGGAPLPVLLVVNAVIGGVLTGFRMPSSNVFVRLLVPDSQVAKALQRGSTLASMAALVAPAVAGLIIAHAGLAVVLVVEICLMGAGIVLLSFLWALREAPPVDAGSGMIDEAQQGFRVLTHIPNLGILLITLALVASSILPAVNTLFQLAGVERNWSAAGTGSVFSAWSAGSVAMSTLIAVLGPRSRPVVPMVAGLLLASASLAGLGWGDSNWSAIIAAFLMGVGVVTYSSHLVPLSILLSPSGSWSRVSSVVSLTQIVPAALVGPALAAGSESWGVSPMMSVSASLGMAAAVLIALAPGLRAARLNG